MIDGGATHNFIDEEFVEKDLKTIEFEGFHATVVENGNIAPCNRVIDKLRVSLGSYSLISDFYVFLFGRAATNGAWGTMVVLTRRDHIQVPKVENDILNLRVRGDLARDQGELEPRCNS